MIIDTCPCKESTPGGVVSQNQQKNIRSCRWRGKHVQHHSRDLYLPNGGKDGQKLHGKGNGGTDKSTGRNGAAPHAFRLMCRLVSNIPSPVFRLPFQSMRPKSRRPFAAETTFLFFFRPPFSHNHHHPSNNVVGIQMTHSSGNHIFLRSRFVNRGTGDQGRIQNPLHANPSASSFQPMNRPSTFRWYFFFLVAWGLRSS